MSKSTEPERIYMYCTICNKVTEHNYIASNKSYRCMNGGHIIPLPTVKEQLKAIGKTLGDATQKPRLGKQANARVNISNLGEVASTTSAPFNSRPLYQIPNINITIHPAPEQGENAPKTECIFEYDSSATEAKHIEAPQSVTVEAPTELEPKETAATTEYSTSVFDQEDTDETSPTVCPQDSRFKLPPLPNFPEKAFQNIAPGVVTVSKNIPASNEGEHETSTPIIDKESHKLSFLKKLIAKRTEQKKEEHNRRTEKRLPCPVDLNKDHYYDDVDCEPEDVKPININEWIKRSILIATFILMIVYLLNAFM